MRSAGVPSTSSEIAHQLPLRRSPPRARTGCVDLRCRGRFSGPDRCDRCPADSSVAGVSSHCDGQRYVLGDPQYRSPASSHGLTSSSRSSIANGVRHLRAPRTATQLEHRQVETIRASLSFARCCDTAAGVLSTMSADRLTGSSPSRSARTIHIRVASASIENISTASSTHGLAGSRPHIGLSASIRRFLHTFRSGARAPP